MTKAQTGVQDATEFIVTPIDETNVWASYEGLVLPAWCRQQRGK